MELKDIKGAGEKTVLALGYENINTVEDLVYTFPKKYDVYAFDDEKAFSGEFLCIKCILDSKPAFISYRPRVYSVIFYVSYQGIRMKCVLFSSDYLRYKLFKGTEVILYGRYKKENKEFLVSRLFFNDFTEKIDVDYKLKNVKNYVVSKMVKSILDGGFAIEETLPESLIQRYRLFSMDTLVRKAHFPKSKEDIHQIARRRKYEEFFWYSMAFQVLKHFRKDHIKEKRSLDEDVMDDFIKNPGFSLTEGQLSAIKDIKGDILSPNPMNRLIQGDVGCGKSIVAVYAAVLEVTAGFQAALMLPTELLAYQQYELFSHYLEKYNKTCAILTSSVKKKERTEILRRLETGEIDLIIGTHALLEDSVVFRKLGLAVIDEQHKFGVEQRKRLVEKYKDVDALYLTATPIPRTLGLTVFGDLDISSIKTMPKGRIPVNTKIVSYDKILGLFKFMKMRIDEGEQVYVVVPMVDENDAYLAITTDEAREMITKALPDVKTDTVHGRMSSDAKEKAMSDFKNGITKILIATTVIEVGVNVPNATIMVIMDADHFGLSQIHQLRGRVGRGKKASYCALVTHKTDNERLRALEVLSDGFGIADEDFKERGPGDYFGSEQSGFSSFEIADFETDYKIWECAREDAPFYFDKYLKGEETSIRFNALILENAKNGSQSN